MSDKVFIDTNILGDRVWEWFVIITSIAIITGIAFLIAFKLQDKRKHSQ